MKTVILRRAVIREREGHSGADFGHTETPGEHAVQGSEFLPNPWRFGMGFAIYRVGQGNVCDYGKAMDPFVVFRPVISFFFQYDSTDDGQGPAAYTP